MNAHQQVASIPNVTMPLHFNQPPPQIQTQTMIANYQQPIEQLPTEQENVSHFEQHQQRDVVSVGVWDENPTIARNDDHSHFVQRQQQSSQQYFKSSGRTNESIGGMSGELDTHKSTSRWYSFLTFIQFSI